MNTPVSDDELRAPSQAPFILLFSVLMAFLGLVWIMFGFSHREIFLGVVGVIFFVVSFFSMRTGLVILIMAMLFSPEFSIAAIADRSVTLRTEDLLIPVLALAWLAQAAIHRRWTLFQRTPLNRPILFLLLLSVISTMIGIYSGWVNMMIGFFYIFKTAEYFLIYFLVVNYVRDEKQIRQFLFFALLTACLLGLYTLPQIPHQTEIFSTHRITAPFEGTPEPGTVGGYMAFLLLITISLFLYERRPKVKWAYALLTVLIFLPFVMTLNRTSYAAFIGGVVVMALLSRNKVLLFLLVGFLACSPLWAPQSVKERIAFTWEDAKNPGRTMGVDFSLQERVMVYRRMWGGVKKNPLIGLGVTSWQTSDSQWARTFHEIGAIGLGLWIWIFLRLFRISRWLFNHIDQGVTKGLALGYAAAMIGLIIHGFGNITFYVVRIMEPFWFITGLVVSLYNVRCGYTDN